MAFLFEGIGGNRSRKIVMFPCFCWHRVTRCYVGSGVACEIGARSFRSKFWLAIAPAQLAGRRAGQKNTSVSEPQLLVR